MSCLYLSETWNVAECDGGTATWALNILVMSGRWRVYLYGSCLRNIPFSQDFYTGFSTCIFSHQKTIALLHLTLQLSHQTWPWINYDFWCCEILFVSLTWDDPRPELPCQLCRSEKTVLEAAPCQYYSAADYQQSQYARPVTFVESKGHLRLTLDPFPSFFWSNRVTSSHFCGSSHAEVQFCCFFFRFFWMFFSANRHLCDVLMSQGADEVVGSSRIRPHRSTLLARPGEKMACLEKPSMVHQPWLWFIIIR